MFIHTHILICVHVNAYIYSTSSVLLQTGFTSYGYSFIWGV